jgi:hypothetical protein
MASSDLHGRFRASGASPRSTMEPAATTRAPAGRPRRLARGFAGRRRPRPRPAPQHRWAPPAPEASGSRAARARAVAAGITPPSAGPTTTEGENDPRSAASASPTGGAFGPLQDERALEVAVAVQADESRKCPRGCVSSSSSPGHRTVMVDHTSVSRRSRGSDRPNIADILPQLRQGLRVCPPARVEPRPLRGPGSSAGDPSNHETT